MKTSTIWESASRPLFVRTVWLEGSDLRRGFQRHFLLDYETKRPLERLKSAVNPVNHKRKDTLRSTTSYDYLESDEQFASDDEIIHLDSAKAKLHEPVKPGTAKNSSRISAIRRRSSVLSRKFQSYDSYYNCPKSANNNRRTSELTDFFSRRSSLQDLASDKLIAPDERLAERVLNWLDLAGNEDFLKNINELKEMEVKLTKTTKLRTDSIKRCISKANNNNNGLLLNFPKPKTQKLKTATSLNADGSSPYRLLNRADAVKHITIIFNKDGQPIRFNRPAKNIDLCTLSASPGTTRRLAGTLASARLYKSAENSRLNTERSRGAKIKEAGNAISARRRLDTVADLTNSTLQKRLQENPLTASYSSLHDSKKQLHIFMPTLPKKGLTMGSTLGFGTDDGVSELSQNFSEYCRV